MSKHIVVIGAGMCGASTAIWLQRAGHEVTLLDPNLPGTGASYGNAGLLASWAAGPAVTPELWGQIPRLIFDRTSGLFMKWRSLPRHLGWMLRYLKNANDAHTHSAAHIWRDLLGDAVDQHKALAANSLASKRLNDSSFAYVYPRYEDFQGDAYSFALKAELGLHPTVLRDQDVQAEMPMLGPKMTCLARFDGHGHILEPGRYIQELVADFEAQGGHFIQEPALDFDLSQGRIKGVLTPTGCLSCDGAVITAGVHSKEVMDKLGLNVPLVAERGYHIVFKNASPLPPYPMLAAGKFGITPMGKDLRCAGTVELAGTDPKKSHAPLELIKSFIHDALPDLTYESTEEWLGFRPSTPDSLPLIGEINKTGVYAGFGHQHLGLTSGPKTGRILAQLISGDMPNIDLSPFDPHRFY